MMACLDECIDDLFTDSIVDSVVYTLPYVRKEELKTSLVDLMYEHICLGVTSCRASHVDSMKSCVGFEDKYKAIVEKREESSKLARYYIDNKIYEDIHLDQPL